MSYTGPTEDIIVQEGTFAFDYDASGSITAGQGVKPIGTLAVRAAPEEVGDANSSPNYHINCVGVAAYNQTNGNPIAVYGPGNIVRVIVSGTSTAVGDQLKMTSEGKFMQAVGAPSGVSAIALEAESTNLGDCRVLLI